MAGKENLNGTDATDEAGVADAAGVADYRHGGTRKNNPPASLAADARVPRVEPIRYAYSPRRDPRLRVDETGAADRLPELLAAAYRTAWRAKMDAVNACIAANAEQEELVDQPQVRCGVVWVSGPFTVEAVQPPEVSLAAPDDDQGTEGLFAGEQDAIAESFETAAAGDAESATGEHRGPSGADAAVAAD